MPTLRLCVGHPTATDTLSADELTCTAIMPRCRRSRFPKGGVCESRIHLNHANMEPPNKITAMTGPVCISGPRIELVTVRLVARTVAARVASAAIGSVGAVAVRVGVPIGPNDRRPRFSVVAG